MALSTALCRVLGIEHPLIQAGMGSECGGTLGFAAQALDLAGDVPIVVAGGIASGRGLAAALAMGAAGAVIGTRFKATHEFAVPAGSDSDSPVARAQKAAIVASDGGNTLYDEINDDACGLAWPNGVTGRVLRNRFTAEWLGRRAELQSAVAAAAASAQNPRAFKARLDGDPETALNWAGESAGMVRAVAAAADVVAEVVRETEALLRRLPPAVLA